MTKADIKQIAELKQFKFDRESDLASRQVNIMNQAFTHKMQQLLLVSCDCGVW